MLITFRSVKGAIYDGRVIDRLNPIELTSAPRDGEYVLVEGTVTHDAEGEALPEAKRMQLSGYVRGVTHNIEVGGVKHKATIWLAPNQAWRNS
jgi:hypothetical protein